MTPEELASGIASIHAKISELQLTEGMTTQQWNHAASSLDAIAEEAERSVLPDLRASTDPGMRDEGARLFRQLAQSNSWLEGREATSRKWIDTAADLAASVVLKDLIASEQDALRDPEMFAGIRELCAAGRVEKAYRLLKSRLRTVTDPVSRRRMQEALADPRTFLGPIKSAPSMTTFNGVGTSLLGERDRARDGTYVATLFVVVLFFPILPLRSYLVRQAAQGWTFYGRVPLSRFSFWWRRLALTLPVLAAACLWGVNAYEKSPAVQEGRTLAAAEAAIVRGDSREGLKQIRRMDLCLDPARRERRDTLARRALKDHWMRTRDLDFASHSMNWIPSLVPDARGWVEGDVTLAVEGAVDALSASPGSGDVLRRILVWLRAASKEAGTRLPHLARRVCDAMDHPALLAICIDSHLEVGAECPKGYLDRLKNHLLKNRTDSWPGDAVIYLRAAGLVEGRSVYDLRVKDSWTGAAPDASILTIPGVPEPLKVLIDSDVVGDAVKRIERIEKVAEIDGLGDPYQAWHRAGVARRLATAYLELNARDPLKHPLSKALPWLLKAVELTPDDRTLRKKAAEGLAAAGDFERADLIIAPVIQDVSFRYLAGVTKARLGKLMEAADLLRPFVEVELPAYVKKSERVNVAFREKEQLLWNSLRNGTADQKLIQRLNKLPDNAAQVEAQEWVQGQISWDPHLKTLLRELEEAAEVQAAAHELAMIELTLGRDAPPGDERTARLSAAEKIFRSLSHVSSDATQELKLGQVCQWLGKETEAAQIFERHSKSEDAETLNELAGIYRHLGRFEEARKAFERAFEKASVDWKSRIALGRALTSQSTDEELFWIKKADSSDPEVRAQMDEVEARLMMERGEYDQAVAPLQRNGAHLATKPETQINLNNAAVNRHLLAIATGKIEYRVEALQILRRAHELDSKSAIALGNYVDVLEDVGATSLAGSALRADLLHQIPDLSWIEWVSPRIPYEEWAVRARNQAEFRRALELSARLVVLSPDRRMGYQVQINHFILTRDLASLRKVREELESSPPAMKDAASEAQNRARGIQTEEDRKSAQRVLSGRLSILPAIRESGHKPTLAFALTSVAQARERAHYLGLKEAEFAKAEGEIDEAVAAFDMPPTRRFRAGFLMDQAARSITDRELVTLIKAYPSLPPGTTLTFYARRNPDKAAELQKLDAVRRASQSVMEFFGAGGPRWVRGWAWLDAFSDPGSHAAREMIRQDPLLLEQQRLDCLLDRESVEDAAYLWLTAAAFEEKAIMSSVQGRITPLIGP